MIVGNVCVKHPELNGARYNSGHCCQCMRDNNRKYNQNHATEVRENTAKRMSRWRSNHTDEQKDAERQRAVDWYYANQLHAQEVARKGRKLRYDLDPAPAIWQARVRRDRVSQQTPVWADSTAISAIYRKARELQETVDHVVPLRGKNVSGLHVEYNLRIVPKSENCSKGNSFLL